MTGERSGSEETAAWMITPPPPPPPPAGGLPPEDEPPEVVAAPEPVGEDEPPEVVAAPEPVEEPPPLDGPPPTDTLALDGPPPTDTPALDGPPPTDTLPPAPPVSSISGVAKDLALEASWAIVAGAIVVAFAVAWLAGMVGALRHQRGLTAADRVTTFFAPGSFTWALAVVLALALLDLGRKFDPGSPRHTGLRRVLPLALLACSVAVVVSAVIGLLVQLASFDEGIDGPFSAMITYLGVLAIGIPSTWWAWKEAGSLHFAFGPLRRRP